MSAYQTLLAVKKPGIGVRVIRAAGVLDQSGAAHVLRLVTTSARCARPAAGQLPNRSRPSGATPAES